MADGAGSGTWGKLTASNLTTTGNSFGAQLLHVREAQSSGVSSTISFAGSISVWNTRALNTTMTNEITGATLASNQISLPAGTYFVMASGIFGRASLGNAASQLRIRNVTDTTTLVVGMSIWPSNGGLILNTEVPACGRFTLAGTKTIEVQQVSTATGSGGIASSCGESEVYCDALFWKIL